MKTFFRWWLVGLIAICLTNRSKAQSFEYDIIVYGGATSGGIAAAIQASRLGKSVLLIEPNQRIGGLTTGGLGQTDIGNKQAIGQNHDDIGLFLSKRASGSHPQEVYQEA